MASRAMLYCVNFRLGKLVRQLFFRVLLSIFVVLKNPDHECIRIKRQHNRFNSSS